MKTRKRIINLSIFIIALFYFSASILFAQDGISKVRVYNTESTILDSTMSTTGQTSNARELYRAYGKEADCACGSWDNSGKCTHYLSSQEREECRKKYQYGGSGTFKINGEMVINGDMVLNGYDGNGNHWINSGVEEGVSNVVGFNKDNGDLLANNNVMLGDSLDIKDQNTSINFGESGRDRIEFTRTKGGSDAINYDCTGINGELPCIPAMQFFVDGTSAMDLYHYCSSDDGSIRINATTDIATLKTDHMVHKPSITEVNYMGQSDFTCPTDSACDGDSYNLLTPDLD